jgi:LysM repeat protein
VLAVLLFAAVLLGAFSLGRTASQAAAPTSPAVVVEHTTVEAGDSLWSVARRVAPENDPREVVEQIRRLNDLPGAQIQVGQQLLLPVAA